ncbi:trimeric LpxA-like protein [Aspergillus indologenus CBS 114.80]|uniref:Trimeric LpxA-like protein n=1 Tax=Aspergillus indologenus CBS 114.80 TaxID=1450541 RepID=A0A2V5I8C8_9EURO|nr:trimeric LpxA-like protein [Aspergillus indologenus CBS 114.80]
MTATSKHPEIIALSQDLRGIPHCEEYERMISGMMYTPIFETRLALLRQLVGKVGEGTVIEPPFKPDYGCNVVSGSRCFINWDVTVLDTSLVVIGDRVQIGTRVSLFTAGHETSVLPRQKFVEFGHPVFIEDDCGIGGNVIILPGVRIGRGSTIGAGSIVTKDIPPFSVAVGAPCRVRKTIQAPEEEEQDPNNPYRDLVREDQ